MNLDSPSYLVLSESYHPNWVAHVNGHRIDSQLTYGCLNGFRLEPGEYDLTLEFRTPPLRTAGNVLSGITAAALSLLSVLLVLKRRREKRLEQQALTTHRACKETLSE